MLFIEIPFDETILLIDGRYSQNLFKAVARLLTLQTQKRQ